MPGDSLERDFERLSRAIEGYRELAIELQRELTAFAAVGPDSGGPGEGPKARYLRAWLEELGVDGLEQYDAPDPRVPEGARPNILAWIAGRGEGPRCWIMSHMDVVPAGDLSKWSSDPFTLRVEGDRLYGRGVEDDQHGIVASLLALRAFRDTGLRPAGDFGVVLVSDEETGNEKGIGHLLKQPGLFKPEDLVVVPDAGDPEGTMIEVAEKSILWLRFHVFGKQCHASTPGQGRNAFAAGSHLVVALRDLYARFPARDPLFDPPQSTFEPTKKEANVPNVNTIPGEDVFYLDCRLLPSLPVDAVLEAVREIARGTERAFGVRVQVEVVQRQDAAPATPPDAPVVRALDRAIRAVHGRPGVPTGIGGGTVAAHFRAAGIPAAVWSTIHDTCHQPDEFTTLPNLLADARILAHLGLHGA